MVETLIVPGHLDALAPIGAFVLQAAHTHGIAHKAAYKLRLAVDEITTNIIMHGYQPAGIQSAIHVYALTDTLALHIAVVDFAPPFDPYTINVPTNLDAPLDERGVGGLGVWLALNQIDSFRYSYAHDCNINILTMYRPLGH